MMDYLLSRVGMDYKDLSMYLSLVALLGWMFVWGQAKQQKAEREERYEAAQREIRDEMRRARESAGKNLGKKYDSENAS